MSKYRLVCPRCRSEEVQHLAIWEGDKAVVWCENQDCWYQGSLSEFLVEVVEVNDNPLALPVEDNPAE